MRPGATTFQQLAPHRRRRLRAVVVAGFVVASVVLPITGEATACASNHGRPYLSDFTGGPAAGSPFYAAGEDQGSVSVTLRVTPGHCVTQTGSTAFYQTQDGVAVVGEDYQGKSGTSEKLCMDVDSPNFCVTGHNPSQTVPVTILPDGDVEDPVEPFLITLSNGQPAGLAEPSSAPIHLIDLDGTNRATLEPSLNGGPVAYQQTEFGSILIPIFWAGPGPVGSVGYTVEPDPARPATPGEDFTVASPNPLPIPADRVGFIRIDIIGDKLGEGDESVIITLQPGPGYTVAEPSSTTFTIVDNEENVFPVSRFHHPRNKWKYNKADYKIREFHIFATDEGGSGVVAAEMALRRNLASGKCAWKVKKGWQKKDCQSRTWLPTKYDDVGKLFYYRMNQLKPSVGTKIKDYTAYSRAMDGAGNVEKEFTKKRNANTFEIRRRGKTQKSQADQATKKKRRG
ncbi:MAG: Calx-beta domain-containing protein [Actinomycetota bacterium]